MSLAPIRPTPHLILGGARSGKSAFAEQLMSALSPPYYYIATAQILDGEMRTRVRRHRERRSSSWCTIEEPIRLLQQLEALQRQQQPVLIDCLTLWLTNLLLDPGPHPPESAIDQLCAFLPTAGYPIFIVSNEVGAGIVPENAIARHFRDLAGLANQRVAAACRSATLVAAGLPLVLK